MESKREKTHKEFMDFHSLANRVQELQEKTYNPTPTIMPRTAKNT